MLNGPIKCWLLDERSDHTAIETIRKSDILKAEARKLVPELRDAALRPATAAEIKGIVGQRFELFPQPKRDEGQWAAWWADYFEALAGLTPYAVEAGMAAWVRSPEAEFMCKPGKLRELATTVPNDNRWARAHMRAAAATRDPVHIEEPKAQPTPAERPSKEEMAAVLADFRQKMQAKDRLHQVALKRRPSPQAKVDETGISAESRALMERQKVRA